MMHKIELSHLIPCVLACVFCGGDRANNLDSLLISLYCGSREPDFVLIFIDISLSISSPGFLMVFYSFP